MLNNIEQAITNVLSANQTPDYYNVADAYFRLFGGPFPSNSFALVETTYSFERALDKYPIVEEKIPSRAPFAEMISEFRRIHWELNLEVTAELMGDGYFPCPCCGVLSTIEEMRQELGLVDDVEAPSVKKSSKKSKSRRLANKKKKSKKAEEAEVFDPYAPSTSALPM